MIKAHTKATNKIDKSVLLIFKLSFKDRLRLLWKGKLTTLYDAGTDTGKLYIDAGLVPLFNNDKSKNS